MERLTHHVALLSDRVKMAGCGVTTHERVTGVNNDCKEAMIFALLGYGGPCGPADVSNRLGAAQAPLRAGN